MSQRFPPRIGIVGAMFLTVGPLCLGVSFWLLSSLWLLDQGSAASTFSIKIPTLGDILNSVGSIFLSTFVAIFAWIGNMFSGFGLLITLVPTLAAPYLYLALCNWGISKGYFAFSSKRSVIPASSLVACVSALVVFLPCFAAFSYLTPPIEHRPILKLIALVAIDAALVGIFIGLFWREREGAA
jgi:hypothetical protein